MSKLSLIAADFFERPVKLRLPFRFGVVTLREAPQVFVRARVKLADGREGDGVAAEILAPKWFDKSANLSNEDNFDQLRRSLAMARSALLAAGRDTPFGLVTRGSNAYVTIAHSDVIDLIKNGQITAAAATGSNFPNGPGQQAPCWIALLGPYLFTSNSPSHSLSRLLAGGGRVVLDVPIAAQTAGAPTDITVDADRLAVVELNGGSTSHLTQFRIDDDGNLVQAATSPIASSANGVAIVSW